MSDSASHGIDGVSWYRWRPRLTIDVQVFGFCQLKTCNLPINTVVIAATGSRPEPVLDGLEIFPAEADWEGGV